LDHPKHHGDHGAVGYREPALMEVGMARRGRDLADWMQSGCDLVARIATTHNLGIVVSTYLAGLIAMEPSGSAFFVLVLALAIGQSRTRRQAFCAVYFFLLGASTTLPGAVAQFFSTSGVVAGYGAWLAYPMPAALCVSTFCRRSRVAHVDAGLIAIGIGLAVLPPVGVFFSAHPVFASGAIFPAGGLVGMLLTVALFAVIAALNLRRDQPHSDALWALTIGALIVSVAMNARADAIGAKRPPENVVAISTTLGLTHSGIADYAHLSRVARSIREGGAADNTLVILPETISAPTSAARLAWWRAELADFFSRGGQLLLGEGGADYSKSAAIISGTHYDWVAARQTTPFSEWRPWGRRSDSGLQFGASVVESHGARISVLQCYEALVPWIAVVTALERADILVFQSNQWWGEHNRGPRVINRHAELLARSLDVPLVAAINR
jgi:apolipoprotein N-acyltransferase